MPSLNHDWLDALAVLRRAIPPVYLPKVFEAVDEFMFKDAFPMYYAAIDIDFKKHIRMPARFPELPKIERVEMMLCLAVDVYCYQVVGESSRGVRENLCKKVGCAVSTTPDIRERWRQIEYSCPAHLLPYANFEDRPTCKVCKQPVCTDSGAWVKKEIHVIRYGTLADALEVEAFKNLTAGEAQRWMIDNNAHIRYRSDIHEECMRYVHRVLVPARQEQIAREAGNAK